VEILHPDSGEPVVEVSGRSRRDPGASVPEHDPYPELTALHGRLVAAALDALERAVGEAAR
jgi:hypothetical protein